MKLKNISITPKPLVLSEKARELFTKFKEANEADESHYYLANAKASGICQSIQTLDHLKTTLQSYMSKGDAVRPDLYTGIKERAQELLTKCDNEDGEAHTDLPRKTDVLEDIAKKLADQLTQDLQGLYLCEKENGDHCVRIMRVSRVNWSLCANGYTADQSYFINFRIGGYGITRRDDGESYNICDNAVVFGRFTIETESFDSTKYGLVTPKQFHSYITKAVQDMNERFGLAGNEGEADGND